MELKYDGEFLNGKRNGIGKEYNYDRKLIFEGEYLNGKRNGKGKEYNDFGVLIFEGEFINDYKSKGKFYVKGKLEYEGEFKIRKKWNGNGYDKKGKIIYTLINGTGKVQEYNDFGVLIFEGEYLNGEKNGKAKEYHEKNGKMSFRVEYLDGVRNGKAKEYDEYGKLIFNGEYINGIKIPKKYN